MTLKCPGCLGKLVDILQAYSTSKGVHCVHFPQVECGSHMCHHGQLLARGRTRRVGKGELRSPHDGALGEKEIPLDFSIHHRVIKIGKIGKDHYDHPVQLITTRPIRWTSLSL